MKKLINVIFALLFTTAFTACASPKLSPKSTPESVARQSVEALYKNDTHTLFKLMHFSKDKKERQQNTLKKMAISRNQQAKKKGGVASITSGTTNYVDDKNYAKVQVTAKFRDGDKITKHVTLIQVNSRWLIFLR